MVSKTVENKTVSRRARVASWFGVEPGRRAELYFEISRGAALSDLVYWLQILFSAGIATLGLVLNSPAVIIGAMLISPLMSPILSAGLAVASGDMVLGVRSLVKIVLSCFLAVGFAVLLVVLLPFREITAEITSRTRPNTLDLFVALFSGTIGAVAVCRDVKGITTSIPGVAIAVALMPPLCVAGYGIGLMLMLDGDRGGRVASGGGLLFVTNLVAITFMAMVVFILTRLNSRKVAKRVEEWERRDPESAGILHFIDRFPALATAREVRSVPLRVAMVLLPLVAITVPLTRALVQLKEEIANEQRLNGIREAALDLWDERFHNGPDGSVRSTVDRLTVTERDGKLVIEVRAIDEKPFTAAEQRQFAEQLAKRLDMPQKSIVVRLTEIPTASVIAGLKPERPPEPSLAELRSNLRNRIDEELSGLELPGGLRIVSVRPSLDSTGPLRIEIVYLGDSRLDDAAATSVTEEVRTRLRDNTAVTDLGWVPVQGGVLNFAAKKSELPVPATLQLDVVGRLMSENPELELTVETAGGDNTAELSDQRFGEIWRLLESRWQIDPSRIRHVSGTAATNAAVLVLGLHSEAQ